jgi:hypothetical protein
MNRWTINTDREAPSSAGKFSPAWEDLLDAYIMELTEWLYDPDNVGAALCEVESTLIQKHHDYGEDNLRDFGELGVLVRVSDKVARLKNLIDKQAEVADENRADTWRDVAGYAIQALIMLKMGNTTKEVDYLEIRKNRLIRGFCPDCGEGVLLRGGWFAHEMICSERCGFFHDILDGGSLGSIKETIDMIAAKRAVCEQK